MDDPEPVDPVPLSRPYAESQAADSSPVPGPIDLVHRVD